MEERGSWKVEAPPNNEQTVALLRCFNSSKLAETNSHYSEHYIIPDQNVPVFPVICLSEVFYIYPKIRNFLISFFIENVF